MPEPELAGWILSGLAPGLSSEVERPAEPEDFSHHTEISLRVLQDIERCDNITADLLPSIVLLCSQHCSPDQSLPWSSVEHQQICERLISVIEEKFLSVGALLSQAEGKMFKSLLSYLQPSLSEFPRHPGSVRSVVWLTEQVVEPDQLEVMVPLLLPHLLRWLDSWLPTYKLSGCQLSQHITAHSSPSQLIFYGRAELLTEPLTSLVSSTEVGVVRAAGQSLLSLTSLRHNSQQPSSPGQADLLLQTVMTSLELCNDTERREVLCSLLRDTVTLLGLGAARWVSSLSQLTISLLDFPQPPPSVFSTLSLLASLCPPCLAREVTLVLPALFKHLYRVSSGGAGETLSEVTGCIVEVARCDVDTARLLCDSLQQTSISFRVKMNVANLTLGELTTLVTEDELGMPHTTEQSFFKPNLTLQKFFNVSIPIQEKINFDGFLENNNLTKKVNELDIIPPIHPSTNFLLFLCSLMFAMFWVTYITFYNSRLVGSITTKIANRILQSSQYYPEAYFKVGSISFSVLAGKIMFRDILFLTPDWSFRSQDGYIIFRWWRAYVPKDVSEDLSHSDTRLSVQLNGLELHTYNRSSLYSRLEEQFGLEPGIIPPSDPGGGKLPAASEEVLDSTEYVLGKNWRDFIPVIKVDISTGKFILGNRLVPTSLLITTEEAHFTYSTKPATCNLDHFMHTVKTKAENLKVVLAESPKYVGLRDEAPRYMGDGFVVLASNKVHLYYYMDQAGRVPETTEMLCLPSGEMVEPPAPTWGLDIQCGKGTDFSYGPWADRQRETLYKFFCPADFQAMTVAPAPAPGDLRVAKKFDIRLNTLEAATLDILFSKQKETRAIHMNISQGSFFDMSIPWVVETEDGYTSHLNGTLMNPEATTSLAYRDFIQCETLEFQLDMIYPKFWNDHQEWNFTFTVSKATVNFIFAHKWFFQDMVEDWASRSPPDIMSFIPYTWRLKFIFKEFELLTAANEFNWIDTSSNNPENAHLAICGKLLSLDFSLPYTEFLPDVVPFKFLVTGERLDLSVYLPDTNTSHHILYTLDNSAKIVGRDGAHIWKKSLQEGKWRRRCLYSSGWTDCWCVPSLALSIDFLYHPCPMAGPAPQADIATPDKELSLLGPLRPLGPQDPLTSSETLSPTGSASSARNCFDPTTFEPDLCKVDLEVGPSVAFLYGTLIRNFMHVKENLFGEDQKFTPMDDSDVEMSRTENSRPESEADLREFRPLSVVLDITVHDLQAHLMKFCNSTDPPCPFLCVEKLVFEMDKSYRETRLQLLLSPVLLSSSDLTERDQGEDHLKAGNLLLTGLQFRGHAMFSELDRRLGEDTLEYAWLMEVQCGHLVGKISLPQLYNIATCLETLLYITQDKENVMKHPRPYKICQHNLKQDECIESHKDIMCPTVEDVKYTMLRFNVDVVDIHIVEKMTAMRLQSCPIRLATCNLHGQQTNRGITAILNNIQLHQYISSNMKVNRLDSTAAHHQDIWIEAGAIKIGPIYIEGAFASHGVKSANFQINQHCFLQKHDRKTKKLWFLWPQAVTKVSPALNGKCGCVGGCNFFGSNENGPTFFKPSRIEIKNRVNVALLTVKDSRKNPGYGQSLLREDSIVLDNCLSYQGNYKILTEGSLVPSWPGACEEPSKLPPCSGFKQPKSVMSNTSSSGTAEGTTPRSMRRQRTGRRSVTTSLQGASVRSSEPVSRPSGFVRSNTTEKEPLQKSRSGSNVDVAGVHRHHSSVHSLAEVKPEPSLVRTESLVSETLSFYSLDGEQSTRPSAASSPRSPRGSGEVGSKGDKDNLSDRTETPTLAHISPDNEDRQREAKSSLSRSVSSNSFISATSEQEDFGMVNLGNQVNKPITESPLLMSSYISHLTQLRCRNWENKVDSMAGKGPHSAEFYGSVFEQFPHYDMINEGFSCMKMFDREQEENTEPIPTPSHPQGFTWGSDMFSFDDTDSFSSNDQQTLMNTLSDSNTSKTTLIVKLRDSIDVIASPIMLESLQRYIEAITPTVELLHPLTVINHLHFLSLDRVEEKNTLKKEKSLDLQDKILTRDSKTSDKKSKKYQGQPLQSVTRTLEKSVSSSIQGSLFLPKINIMILQASVVEEMCAFSALDNVKDITCVSFLALGIQETSFKIHKTSQSKKIVQVLSQNNKLPSTKKRKSKYKKIAQLPHGTLAFESSERQLEEIIMTGSINKVHVQLRRLKNDSSLLKDASITAIPDHRSQVFFEYLNVPKFGHDDFHESQESFNTNTDVHPLGFNMGEVGLEGIHMKVSKKSSKKESGVNELDEDVKVHEENERAPSESKEQSEEPDETPDLEVIEKESIQLSPKSPKSPASPVPTLKNEPLPVIPEAIETMEDLNKEVASSQGNSSKAAAHLNIKNVWFNFAAPPKTPITKKIDFTKLDWNLLSTATPGIDAWLNPFDRIQQTTSTIIDRFNWRVGAIMASVMAEALDEQQVHIPKVSKYENLTALAKTLKDDPSCQLCSVLKRYVFKKGIEDIELNLDPKVVPPLTTLRQGIVVLSRQWKNVIYTPILIQYNLKTSGMKNLYQRDMNLEEVEETDETSDEDEVFSDIDLDEETQLIKGNSLGRADHYRQEGSIISNLSFLKNKGLRSPHRSPNSEDILALLENGASKFDMTSAVPGGSVISDDSGAVRSYKSDKLFSGPSSPAIKKATKTQVVEEEDLYTWMRRQQQNQSETGKEKSSSLDNKPPREGQNEKSVHIQIEEDVKARQGGEQITRQANSGNSFLDTHIIFEPLLSSLGLMPQQITNLSLKNLGRQVVVGGGVDVFKIDIVESEIGKVQKKGKVKFPKITIDPDSHTPAFICEKIVLHLDFKKITDILKGEKLSKDKVLPLYVSRNQLKRHTSSFANFSIEVDIISQKVNMPLLRLLNQIVTMHLNVKETSEELKEKKPSVRLDQSFRRHKKTSSGSSTSDVGSVTLRPDELSLLGSSINLHTKEPAVSRLSNVVQTPSPSTTLKTSLKNRPKGFASKFRPNSRLGGYSSLGESPLQEQQDSFILGGHPLEKITEEQFTKCWRTVYHLLDLYATLPETKIIAQRSSIPNLSTPMEVSIIQKSKMKYAAIRSEHIKTPDAVKMDSQEDQKFQSPLKKEVSFARADTNSSREHMPLIVTGEAKINKVNLTATLSGLRLEGEINGLGASISYKERVKAIQKGVNVEASITGNMKETSIALLEGVSPGLQTVVRLTVGPTETNYTSHMWKTKDKNQGHLSIGPVHVDIPQHPVMLHGIMTRSTKQITNTLMEFKGTRILYKGKTAALDDSDLTQQGSPKITETFTPSQKQQTPAEGHEEESNLIKPLVMKFQLSIESFAVSAALLPSLQAQYKMENVTSKGVTGSKANFNIILPKHTLSFNTKLEEEIGLDNTLPSEASIDLPRVYILAEYMQDESTSMLEPNKAADGSMYTKGNFFKAKAEIGELDHCLTTDMLNHLVFVQKVFMKEVNEVVQKMTGGDRLVSVWTDFGEEFELHHSAPSKQLLYTVSVELKRITITATTPSNSAVRFETGTSELVLSNRVSNVQGAKFGSNKIAFKAKIHLKLSLGQLFKDLIYPEAESQFQQHAYFKTSIQLRNALEDESSTEESKIPDKEVILITLNRPLIFLQPIAVDKAILVWLSYKNAWEYWAEQRSSLNKEVLIATQQVIERVPISQLREQISSQHVGTLFLQLNVTDIGVAIPITTDSFGVPLDNDSKGAIVCTVETTSISACSATSVASKGKFEDLCVRFCEDFNHTLDDWKPDRTDDNLLNLCNVSDGSYEVCSKTYKAGKDEETGNFVNAKWILNIQWQMTGVEVQVDTDIGKHLTALGHTLTLITGDEEDQSDDSSLSDELDSDTLVLDDNNSSFRRQKTTIQLDNLPDFVFDPSIEAAQRTKMMEREMIEQSKIIEDLRKLGASENTVTSELKKLSDMEAFASKDFRRDIIQKIRRQSARTQSIKEKFGLGSVNAPQMPPQRGISIMKTKSSYQQSPLDEAVTFEQSVRSRLESEMSDLEVERTFGGSRERKVAVFKSRYDTIDEDSLPSSPGSPRDDKSKTSSIISERLRGTVSPKQQAMASNLHSDKKSSEPNVDFEFDFKIFVNSGKCVLHAKPEEYKTMKKDKSYSGSGTIPENSTSPLSNRRQDKSRPASDSKERPSISNVRIRPVTTTTENSTVFFIPGLDVKVHYISKTESDYEISYITSEKQDSLNASNIQRESHLLSMTKKNTNKKATLTTWMTLQSIPEETVISPAILEFLEQALEPIPVNKPPSQDHVNIQGESDADGTATLVTTYSSFPVDVIVYFHMKSNKFRFSCLPVSRIECMLTLPSLDLVFSSKRADADIMDDKEPELNTNIPDFDKTDKKTDEKKDMFDDIGSGGGLSVTGCLSDFSMHVFHPYGGARKMRRDESVSFSPPKYYEERKDSLSVNVAFVKFHLSRTRRMTVVHTVKDSTKLPKQSSDTRGKASIRFSTIVDIGKATFIYDMRRLTEILAFPKAWYRRTLVRRLFLGELKTTNIYTDIDSPADFYEPVNPHMFNVKAQDSPVTPHAPFIAGGRKSSLAGTPTQKRQSITLMPERRKSSSPAGTQPLQSWETLVLFAIKFKELEVGMNMGNVMGNVLWVSKDFTSDGRLSIGSSGHKNISIGLGLKGSSLEAKGGIIGGCIDIGKIDTYLKVLEDSGVEPLHKLGARLDAMEVRFDYMGTSVLMGRVSLLKVNLKNEWQVGDVKTLSEAGSTRAAMVFVFGDLQWDQFQLMISKSTTADLLKIYSKLEEFFVQQFKSSKRVLSILEPWSAAAAARDLPGIKLGKRSSASFRSNSSQTVSHHRHWQHALEFISGLKIKTMPVRLPTSGAILGGTLELSGKHISLACFHGINFKAKSWALFSMKDPFISFNSEAQGVQVEGERATNVVQNLVFSLGMGEPIPLAQHVSMATVCKISRNYMYSPQFKLLSEWFSYAFHTSSLDQVDRFPVLGGQQVHRPSQTYRDKGVYNQANEIIFALPCLRMDLKTDHIQGERPPSVDESSFPQVDCSFVTDFEDHIFVTVDAEAFFFLHDLISSYIKEKDKFVSSQASGGAGHSPHTGDLLNPDVPQETRHSPKPTESKSDSSLGSSDWRVFECKTWHLEPTVRLQSWAGKKIEPYGVDYILQKLGFSHAKTTIPKWMQRGFMDPLDKILSVIVLNAIVIVSEETEEDMRRRKVSSSIVSKSESFGKKH